MSNDYGQNSPLSYNKYLRVQDLINLQGCLSDPAHHDEEAVLEGPTPVGLALGVPIPGPQTCRGAISYSREHSRQRNARANVMAAHSPQPTKKPLRQTKR